MSSDRPKLKIKLEDAMKDGVLGGGTVYWPFRSYVYMGGRQTEGEDGYIWNHKDDVLAEELPKSDYTVRLARARELNAAYWETQ